MVALLALRALAMSRHRAASAKVSRLKSKGVNVAGTEFDVRRPAANIKRYNKRQLESYISRLNQFTARSNSFVAGSEGAPIPRADWQKYERIQNAVNYRAAKRYSGIKDIKINPLGRSVGSRDADTTRQRERAKGALSHRTLTPVDREAHEITSAKSLRKLTSDLQKKLHSSYVPKRLNSNREAIEKMLKTIGNHEMLERMQGLSDDQFTVLWEYSSSPEEIVPLYQIAQARGRGEKLNRARVSMEPTHMHELSEYLDWAEQLPRNIDRYNA